MTIKAPKVGDAFATLDSLCKRIESAEAVLLVELPESGTRRDRKALTTYEEVLITLALRDYAEKFR